MKSGRFQRMMIWATFATLPLFNTCVTNNQLQGFIHTEMASLTTQVVTEPFTTALHDLTGPQITEEEVPSLGP